MSGACCPDCGESWFEPAGDCDGRRVSRCQVCGWEGSLHDLPSEWREEEPGPSLMDLRKAGKLAYIRVWFDTAKKDSVVEAVMSALKLNGVSYAGGRILIQRKTKPSDEVVAKLRAIPGVTNVSVF